MRSDTRLLTGNRTSVAVDESVAAETSTAEDLGRGRSQWQEVSGARDIDSRRRR
jgi:hypothetical protein